MEEQLPSAPGSGPLFPLHIERAGSAWGLVFQSGVEIGCLTGITLGRALSDGLGLSTEQLAGVDTLLLDGMPVDTPEHAMLRNGARLALAAGLPGIAGLAMKRGSAVRALRAGITHADETADMAAVPAPGRIVLFLYSLAMPRLAPHFLRRGIFLSAAQLERYGRFSPDDACLLGPRAMRMAEVLDIIPSLPPAAVFSLTAHVRS